MKCQSRLNYKPQTVCLDGVKVRSLYVYDSEFSRLLIQYKENLDIELRFVFKELIRELKIRNKQKVVMPSSVDKLAYRGFNHVKEIFGQDCLDPFIKVSEHKQVGLSRKEREKVSFHLKQEVKGKVILLDDVITTGSTLKEAIRLLRPHCQIECFTIAYKP